MTRKLLIIKFGGSVITDKNQSKPKIRKATLKNLSQELYKLYQSSKYQIILVHGAGSFGHPLAKKYDLQNGMKTFPQKIGFSLVSHTMLKLSMAIMQNLVQDNIPAVILPPHALIEQSSGQFQGFNHQIIQSYLNNGQVPILYGDVVPDNKWASSIISGDTIVTFLAKKLKADKVVFLSDVDGVFDSDPKKNPQAKLIPTITNKNLQIILQGLSATGRDDVTGEMYGKIMNIKNNLPNITVYIANGLKQNNLTKIVKQQQTGTKLCFN